MPEADVSRRGAKYNDLLTMEDVYVLCKKHFVISTEGRDLLSPGRSLPSVEMTA